MLGNCKWLTTLKLEEFVLEKSIVRVQHDSSVCLSLRRTCRGFSRLPRANDRVFPGTPGPLVAVLVRNDSFPRVAHFGGYLIQCKEVRRPQPGSSF